MLIRILLTTTESGEYVESYGRLKWASQNRQNFPANLIFPGEAEEASHTKHCKNRKDLETDVKRLLMFIVFKAVGSIF